jgi:hypothetical protein
VSPSPTSSTRSLSPISFKNYHPTGVVYPPTPPLDASDVMDDAAFPFIPPASFASDSFASLPQAIPIKVKGSPAASLLTPPLTPEDDGPLAETRPLQIHDDALDLLSTLFPKDGIHVLPHARKVSISAPELGAAFEGVVLDLPNEPKTFYVDGKSAASVNLRERYGIWY